MDKMDEIYSNRWINGLVSKSQLSDPDILAKILSSIKKFVNIVNDKNDYVVIFDEQENSGYINYGNKKIVISSKLVVNSPNDYTIYDVVDILTGITLHESGHAKFSKKFKKSSIENSLLVNNGLFFSLYNIVEDAIIEKLVSTVYPGYENYFIKTRKHYFDNELILTDSEISNILNDFLLGIRCADDYKIKYEEVRNVIDDIKNILELPINKLRNVNRIEICKTIYDKLFPREAEKPEAAEKSGEIEKSEEMKNNFDNIDLGKIESELSSFEQPNIDDLIGGNLKDFIDEKKSEKKSKLDLNIIKEINSNLLTDEKAVYKEKEFKVIESNAKSKKNINVAKKEYKENYKEVKNFISLFRNNIQFANTPYKVNCYNLQSGVIDEDNLYSAKYNTKIFKNTLINIKCRTNDIDLAFVIDHSRSMISGHMIKMGGINRITLARRLCILFIEALKDIQSINTFVYGFQRYSTFNGDINDIDFQNSSNVRLFNMYSPKNRNKHSLFFVQPESITPEYEALCGMWEILKHNGNKNKKVIIMLTDGLPLSSVFDNEESIEKIKEKIKQINKQNGEVIHLELNSIFTGMEKIYNHSIKWKNDTDYKTYIKQFLKELNKIILK